MKEKVKINKLILFSSLIYLLLLTWIIVFKLSFNIHSLKYIQSINLTPFTYPSKYNGVSEFLINVLLFIPVGIYIKALFKSKNIFKNIFPIFLISLSYETIQYFLCIGVSDITDIIMNLIGGIIGLLFISIIYKIFHNFFKYKYIDNVLSIMSLICIIGSIIFIIIF